MAVSVDVEYISVGCNQTPHCLDWNAINGVLAYGAENSIALAIQGRSGLEKVVSLLPGHTRRVNCVRWIPGSSLLVSGAVDGNVIVWQCQGEITNWGIEEKLTDHAGPINCVVGISQESEEKTVTTIASSSSDHSIKVWERETVSGQSQFRCIHTVSCGDGFVLGLDLCSVDGHLVLACGSDTGSIDVYAKQGIQFLKLVSLLGHKDWVRALHFVNEGNGYHLLASCSQDCSIRLWKLFREGSPDNSDNDDDLKVTENSFVLVDKEGKEKKYIMTLESVLIGHEDWVYSVRWQPKCEAGTSILLSASMDKTMVLWAADPESGVWLEQVRVGDVGGNSLGLYGAVFGPHQDYIIAHGYQGTFSLWKKVTSDHWKSIPTISGHYGPVQDIAWEPMGGEFLLSVSSDQTTRAHAPWILDSKNIAWRELARPQIHGYDMRCICFISSILFLSGADEKVLRVFHSPKDFVERLLSISKVKLQLDHKNFPTTASVPSLGLSNKAVFSAETPVTLTAVPRDKEMEPGTPFEDQLQNTLWPEIHKLYGHSYEIFCVDSSPDGKYVASACMASKQEYASILMWDTSSWRQVQSLCHHNLTVTQLAFSHSSQFLLAVSRDRTWSLWKKDETKGLFCLETKLDKNEHVYVHSRIIWSCSWTPDDAYFATGSRDKKVLLWSIANKSCNGDHCSVKSMKGLHFDQAVTAVDFAPVLSHNKYLLAVGLENGVICIYGGQVSNELNMLIKLNKLCSHTALVKRLRWRPDTSQLSLASCSTDYCVKIFKFNFL